MEEVWDHLKSRIIYRGLYTYYPGAHLKMGCRNTDV